MEKEMNFYLLKKQIGKEIRRNIVSGNDQFEMLFDYSKQTEKDLKKIKSSLQQMQIVSGITKANNKHIVMYINFGNSPAVKLVRNVYKVQ